MAQLRGRAQNRTQLWRTQAQRRFLSLQLPSPGDAYTPVYPVNNYRSRGNGRHCPGLQAPFPTRSQALTTTLISPKIPAKDSCQATL